jgi:kumamolisin
MIKNSSDIISQSIYLVRDTHDNGMTILEYADAVIAGTHPVLDHSDFLYHFGSTEDNTIAVADFFSENGFTIVEAHRGKSRVRISGTVDNFNKTFGITLVDLIDDTGRKYMFYEGKITWPDTIANLIEPDYDYFDESFVAKHHAVKADQLSPLNQPSGAVNPAAVATVYGIPPGTGYGAVVGIFELTITGYSQSWYQPDVNATFSAYSNIPSVIKVDVDGALSQQSSASELETMLDIYCAGGVNPNGLLVTYFGFNSGTSYPNDVILAIANDTTYNPTVCSISYGIGDGTTYDVSLAACIVKGITPFVSSGDSGANNYNISASCTSPYMISAGGTSLYYSGSPSTRVSETAWAGSGGGVSTSQPLPSWQTGLTSTKITQAGVVSSPVALSKRAIPDISAPADPNTGYQFYGGGNATTKGQLTQVGGTSASAPLLAGIWAKLNSLLGYRIPFNMTTWYTYATSQSGTVPNPLMFYDITSGNNADGGFGYNTTTGWDAATGLGTPNVGAIYQYFRKGATYPKQNYGYRVLPALPVPVPYPRINTGVGRNNNAFVLGTAFYSIIPNINTIYCSSTVTYTVQLYGVGAGTLLYWTNDGTAGTNQFTDNAYYGSITTSTANQSFTITRTTNNQYIGTTTNNTIILSLRAGSATGPILGTAATVTVSTATTYSATWTSSGACDNFVALCNGSFVSNLTYTNLPANSTVYWSQDGSAPASTFTDGVNSGSVSNGSNINGTLTVYRTVSTTYIGTTGGNGTYTFTWRSGSTTGTVIAGYGPSYGVTGTQVITSPQIRNDPNNVNQLGGVSANNIGLDPVFLPSTTFTIYVVNVAPGGSTITWRNTGTAPGSAFTDGLNTGTFTASNDIAYSLTRTINNSTTSGTLILQLSWNGNILNTYQGIQILPGTLTYVNTDSLFVTRRGADLGPSGTGGAGSGTGYIYFRIATQVGEGATLYLNYSGSVNIGTLPSYYIDSTQGSGTTTIAVPYTDTATTGTGYLTVLKGSNSGTVLGTSPTVTILAGGITVSPSTTVNLFSSGNSITYTFTAQSAITATFYWQMFFFTPTAYGRPIWDSGSLFGSIFGINIDPGGGSYWSDNNYRGSVTFNNSTTATVTRILNGTGTAGASVSMQLWGDGPTAQSGGWSSNQLCEDNSFVFGFQCLITTTSATTINPGTSVTYNITFYGAAGPTVGQTVYWTNAGTSVASQFSDGVNSGSFTYNGGTNTVTRLPNSSPGYTTLILTLRSGSITGPVVGVCPTTITIT